MIERILQSVVSTISVTFTIDGQPTDPSGNQATVGITRDDGSVLVSPGTATARLGVGNYSFTLSAAQAGQLDILHSTWSTSNLGAVTTYTEIVGDYLFSIDAARVSLGDNAFDAQAIADARTYAESEIEDAVGYALVPRYRKDVVFPRRGLLRLAPHVRAIRSVKVNGVPLPTANLNALYFQQTGHVFGYWWSCGPVEVAYEHGLDTPSSGARNAVLGLATEYLGGATGSSVTSIHPRATSISTVDGTIQLRSSAGQFAAIGVNEWIRANRMPNVA